MTDLPQAGSVPSLLISAPASGSGKTTVTLGLINAFCKAGHQVGSFKVGPDYIDPAFHVAAGAGRCRNLDGWAMTADRLDQAMADAGIGADMIIGEGVMGLFDGAGDGAGSTADIAARYGLPAILVVDVRAQAASAAALIQGFAGYRADVDVAGVILNRVGSPRHEEMLRQAIAPLDMPVLGCLPRSEGLDLPSRHLGLVQAQEHGDLAGFADTAGRLLADAVDLEGLRALARPPSLVSDCDTAPSIAPLGQRLALASDQAFAFAYPHVLDDWRAAGATIMPFSPLADEAPAVDADAVYLPGGYPELHAGRLAFNQIFLSGLRDAAARPDTVIYGECGGYMVLGRQLTDGDGVAHAMAGLLPVETSFAAPSLTLGYRRIQVEADGPLGAAGSCFRGHEFHYAGLTAADAGVPALFQARDAVGTALGAAGHRVGRVMGSFLHLIDGGDG